MPLLTHPKQPTHHLILSSPFFYLFLGSKWLHWNSFTPYTSPICGVPASGFQDIVKLPICHHNQFLNTFLPLNETLHPLIITLQLFPFPQATGSWKSMFCICQLASSDFPGKCSLRAHCLWHFQGLFRLWCFISLNGWIINHCMNKPLIWLLAVGYFLSINLLMSFPVDLEFPFSWVYTPTSWIILSDRKCLMLEKVWNWFPK